MKMVAFERSALVEMGKRMRAAADQYPCDTDQIYSKSQEEAMMRTMAKPDRGLWLLVGLTQVVDLRHKLNGIVSVSLSKETFCNPHQYRLSMLFHGSRGMFQAVPEEVGNAIVRSILNDPKSVDNPSGLAYASHFIQIVETPSLRVI